MRSDPQGTCFPSSHVAVAWVALFCLRRIFGNRWFALILPFTLSLTVAVVYNRYHYLADALAGLATAWLCYQGARRLYGRWLKKHPSPAIPDSLFPQP
jgi:membrane-associated phospholipid phosphatase